MEGRTWGAQGEVVFIKGALSYVRDEGNKVSMGTGVDKSFYSAWGTTGLKSPAIYWS
jgi:hypothetical protein